MKKCSWGRKIHWTASVCEVLRTVVEGAVSSSTSRGRTSFWGMLLGDASGLSGGGCLPESVVNGPKGARFVPNDTGRSAGCG